MKSQIRTHRHCPRENLPEYFEVLIDGVIYKFAKSYIQPEIKPDNSLLYDIFIEDGLVNK